MVNVWCCTDRVATVLKNVNLLNLHFFTDYVDISGMIFLPYMNILS